MAKALIPIFGVVLLVLVFVLAYAFVMWVARRAAFRREADAIKLASLRKQAELEALLLERQHTWSLEDIQRHRARLEHDLDDLHGTKE